MLDSLFLVYFEKYKFDIYNLNEIITAAEKQSFISKVETGDIEGMEECVAISFRKVKYGKDNYSPVLIYDILQIPAHLTTHSAKS